MQMMSSQTFWTAIAALATVAYLIASYFLWKTAKDNSVATRELISLTRESVNALVRQTEANEAQLELSRKTFLETMQPVVSFVNPIIIIRGDHAPTRYEFAFKLLNNGNMVAEKLRWEIDLFVNGSPISHSFSSREEFQLIPHTPWEESRILDDHHRLKWMGEIDLKTVEGEFLVRYTSPLDKKMYKSSLHVSLDVRSGTLIKSKGIIHDPFS